MFTSSGVTVLRPLSTRNAIGTRGDRTGSPDRRAAERHKQLRRIDQALCSGARKPQPRLRQAPLRVDDVQDPGIADGIAAPREIERGSGGAFGLAFGTKLIGMVCERL